eukprot:12902903-Prorocentrum_lima.AAC.1
MAFALHLPRERATGACIVVAKRPFLGSKKVWWPSMLGDVRRWVCSCAVGKITKPRFLSAEARTGPQKRPFPVLEID